jgi:hypothetical protein
MDRKALYEKIHAMLRLQESTNFEGEAAAAAALIDKLCRQYGVTLDDILTPEVIEEVFAVQKKLNNAEFMLFTAVGRFYDAAPILRKVNVSGQRAQQKFVCVGTEAQQIQTKLYYEYLHEVMERECKKALTAEKLLAEIQGKTFLAYGFSTNFKKAFVEKVESRLNEIKKAQGDHPHKNYTLAVYKKMKLGTIKSTYKMGAGAMAGAQVGASVGLSKQASGAASTPMLSGSF